MLTLAEGARRAIMVGGGAGRGQRVVVLTDDGRPPEVGEALLQAAREAGSLAELIRVPADGPPGSDLPGEVGEAIADADLVVGATSRSLAHTDAGRAAAKRGARIMSMTGCDVRTLTEGAIEADFAAIEPRCRGLAAALTNAAAIRITAPGGSQLEASLVGRAAVAGTGMLRSPGEIGGFPDLEAYIAPVEGTANGLLVIDGSATALGLLDRPVEIEVRDGVAVAFHGGPLAGKIRELAAEADPVAGFVLAEIGIGLNPSARVVGSIIEDEATYGTGHFALGSNETFGGANRVAFHLDLVYWHPTIVLDGRVVMSEGAVVDGAF